MYLIISSIIAGHQVNSRVIARTCMTLSKFQSCLSDTASTIVITNYPVIIVCVVCSIELSTDSRNTSTNVPERILGKTDTIRVFSLIDIGESVLQKKASSRTLAVITSLRKPVETLSGYSNSNLKKIRSFLISSIVTLKPRTSAGAEKASPLNSQNSIYYPRLNPSFVQTACILLLPLL